jgi:hypothetical protein
MDAPEQGDHGPGAIEPMLDFLDQHDACGASFAVTVRLAEEAPRYQITCSGCSAEFSRPLPGSDARYSLILQGVSLTSGN